MATENLVKKEEKPKPEEEPAPEKPEPVKEEPKIIIPDQKSEKSFFEVMWEKDHPEEVKKLNLAEEQKKMEAKAKKL